MPQKIAISMEGFNWMFTDKEKLPKPNTLALTFSNTILSQSIGVVLNSTHELYSCKANCISSGSYFRITIALNYST